MSQSHIDEFVHLVRGKEAKDLGPAILYVNQLSIVDMLKAFESLNPEDRKRFDQAAFSGIPAKFSFDSVLPEAKRVNIERIKFAFLVVTEKRVPSKVPETLYETGQLLVAYQYLTITPPTKNVWVSMINDVCEDARLNEHDKDKESTGKILDKDTFYGQAGWDIGIRQPGNAFHALPATITQRCKPHLINKFGLNAHGDSGEVAVNGVYVGREPGDWSDRRIANKPALGVNTLRSHFGNVLDFFNHVIVPTGSLTFYSCLAGRGAEGEKFLKQLSLELRPRKVIAFTSLGFTAPIAQSRRSMWGGKCVEPGVRDTSYSTESSEATQYTRYLEGDKFKDLQSLPWQSDTSPHVKVAQNGNIVHQGPDAN